MSIISWLLSDDIETHMVDVSDDQENRGNVMCGIEQIEK
jgi:hypothetical protein